MGRCTVSILAGPALGLVLGCNPGVLQATQGDDPLGPEDGAPPLRLPDGSLGAPSPPPGVDAGAGAGDICGDVRSIASVFYGTVEPTYLELSPGQILSIGMLDLGGGLCSGTVIAPRWFLTAAHCTFGASPSGTTIRLGSDPSSPDIAIPARAFQYDLSADISLVELSMDATAAAPGLVPLPIVTESLDSSWIGRPTEASGYGRTERGSSGTRYFSVLPIQSLSPGRIQVDGGGTAGVCHGDSGGPMLGRASDGSVRVIGVVSSGERSCTGDAYFGRVDRNRDWIESHTGPTAPPGPPPCEDVTIEGRCIDGRAVWCGAEDTLQTVFCTSDQECGWDAGAAGYRCVPEGTDPCGGVDRYGRCDGEVARWCDRGVARSRDCAACGQTCGVVDEHRGVYCTDDG